ncbi:Polysaccharide deacetylase [Chondromyces apiculatus DSM 436]|uniref:Polysaccharide deacetylase n=2 Tax=Chondromyces apiculatus TaxID=51 RepID=A0A017T9F9_9BACT|nr:Polysaccharide deacetylase [Chondromyces apiculatus DSM 436]
MPTHPTPAPRPSSPRAIAADALDSLGLLDGLLWLRGRCRVPLLGIFTYHRIAEPDGVGELDGGVAEASVRELREQIALIKAHCTALTLDDLCRGLRGAPLPPNPVLITFDDGYRDCHDIVLPILREAGISATFFIPTRYPDAGRIFWWDRVHLTLRRCCRDTIEISYPVHLVLHPLRNPKAAADRLSAALKRTPRVDIDRSLAELERATGVTLTADEERDLAANAIMGWDHIRALRAAGMDIQSHGHGHGVLNTMSPEDAQRDLTSSRRVLTDVLSEPVRAVAYPVGYPLSGAYRDAVIAAGFEIGFTNNTGLCLTTACDPLNLPRVAMDRGQVGPLYKLKLLAGERYSPAT